MDKSQDNKYVFLIDADGTLVQDGTKVVKNDILEKIKALKEKGHIFVIATGRVLNDVTSIKGSGLFDYYAVLMGDYIFDSKTLNVVQSIEYLQKETVKNLVKYLDENDIYWSYKTAIAQKSYHQARGIAKKFFAEECSKEEYKNDLQSGKIQQILTDGYVDENVQKQFSELNFFEMPQNYTDISHKNASKANGGTYFKKNFKDYSIVAIGDSQNDLPMLTTADISIAMGNACDDIKKCAKFVTTDINDNGIINAFNMLKCQ